MRTEIFGRAVAVAASLLAAATLGVVGAAVSASVTSTPVMADSTVGGEITRSEVLARAGDWYSRRHDPDMTYSMEAFTWDGTHSRRYRRDCSGLVGMAWHLNADPDTRSLDNYADPISRSDLLPGDILNDTTDSEPSPAWPYHAILFGGWENAAKTRFWYYSFGKTPMERVTGASFSSSTLSGHPTSEYRALRYRKIVDEPRGNASVYGVLADGRLTYTVVNSAGVRTHGAISSTATLGFVPVAMAVLNFNTILITSDGGQLYRIDVITNNTSLVFNPPVHLGGGWTHRALAYDGSGHLYGLAGNVLRRYTVNAAKPDLADITTYTTIDSGFSQKTLTATGPDWILGNHTDGRLLSYHVTGANNWNGYTLRGSTWQVFDHIISPGGGVYLAHKPDGSMRYYVDTNPYDGNGNDITNATIVDPSGWTQILLSAQPGTVS
jgi:hypothetical protein